MFILRNTNPNVYSKITQTLRKGFVLSSSQVHQTLRLIPRTHTTLLGLVIEGKEKQISILWPHAWESQNFFSFYSVSVSQLIKHIHMHHLLWTLQGRCTRQFISNTPTSRIVWPWLCCVIIVSSLFGLVTEGWKDDNLEVKMCFLGKYYREITYKYREAEEMLVINIHNHQRMGVAQIANE